MLSEPDVAPLADFARFVPRARSARFLDALRRGSNTPETAARDTLLAADLDYGQRLVAIQGIEPPVMAALISAEYEKRSQEHPAEIAWTGPPLEIGYNFRTTSATIRTIVANADRRILLAGYILDLKVLQTLGIIGALKRGISVQIVANRANLEDHALDALISHGAEVVLISFGSESFAKFHVKAIAVDERVALVTSANFTSLGQHGNVELGVVVQGDAARLVDRLLSAYARRFGSLAE